MEKIKISDFNNWKLSIKKEDYFLDIGCWDGKMVLDLMNKCNSFGIDIDKDKISLADPRIKKRLKVADGTKKIPFKEKFDYIYLSEVIEHVENDESLLKNISDSLKIGGKLILTTPRSVRFFEFWDPAWVKWKLGGSKHYHYQIEELKNKLEKNNLRIKNYIIVGTLSWVVCRWANVFLKFILKSKKKILAQDKEGFVNIRLIAEKLK